MTKAEVAKVESAVLACDPRATVYWDWEHETLTVTCSAECTETVRTALDPRPEGLQLLVIRFQAAA